ncbi:MAG: hypothetical protein Q9220_003745 [cf. Caloplaca sp. 1 TL-2023]
MLKLLLKDPNKPPKNRAPAQPSLENTESSASSLVDVDSPHVSSVPSDFESQATQTKTQADRMAHEAEDKARETSNKASQKTKETAADADKKASEASSKASGKAKEFSEYASEKSEELSKEAGDKYDKAKKSAARNYREGKEEAKEKGNELSRNRDNPVVVGNALIIGIGGVALGVAGYQKYAKGELSWQLAGIAAGAVSVFAVGDYYLSQYLFQNKYPKNAQTLLQSLDNAPVVHFTLARRGGTFEATIPGNDSLEMDYLLQELHRAEARFNFTRREVKGNKLVRKAKSKAVGGNDDESLMGDIAANGTWFARLTIGEPPQSIDLDLSMLTSDFYVRHTTSHAGSRFDDLFSKTFGTWKSSVDLHRYSLIFSVAEKSKEHPHRSCTRPKDIFHVPTLDKSVALRFPYCRPLKVSQETLQASGSMLGLAPSKHLRQIDTPFFVHQLLEERLVERPIVSLMLVSGREGVLSVGGTAVQAVKRMDKQTAEELDRAGAQEKIEAFTQQNGKTLESGANSLDKTKIPTEKIILHKRGSKAKDIKDRHAHWEDGWTWSKVQGAEGWWQTLMQGVWVGRSRVLQNQAVVVDINTPFILAPPLAAKTFYAGVAGSRPLEPPYSNFYVFPCMNPPHAEFEFSGTRFPAMQGGRGMEYSSAIIPGGKFSLGRLKHGSGYCVGAIVETQMGLKDEREGMTESGKQGLGPAAANVGSLAGNGMRDVWVIGERFFRGIGAVFDVSHKIDAISK